MPDWQVTAMSMYCDCVGEEVTVMVYGDWTVKCTGYEKFAGEPTPETLAALQKKSKRLGKQLKCLGPLDDKLIAYRDRLAAEER